MSEQHKVRQLLDQLREDRWRKEFPFSEHISVANRILIHPFSDDHEKQEALGLWLQKYQPCIFGRVAARLGQLHYCFLTDADLRKSDLEIQAKIQREKIQWKQWSLDGGTARHSFLLVVASERVLLAAPDNNLKEFCIHLRSLFTTELEKDEEANDLGFQCVYLKNPHDGHFYKFNIIMDFFAAAGDGRWWLDHRVPGGLAFSFNSLGHMVRTKEWYGGEKKGSEWALKLAMTTIATAEDHPKFGKATWLKDLKNDKPMKSQHGCPFSNPKALPASLQNKDWTTYAGFHHSDHSIRDEFFLEKEAPLNLDKPFLIDFSYIYANNREADSALMNGNLISEAELYKDIGEPETWRRDAPREKTRNMDRPEAAVREINEILKICRQWELHDEEVV